MSLSSIWRVLLRRWYVTVVGLILTVVLAIGGAVLSPPTYEAHATVLLIPPTSNQLANPFLGLGGLQEVSDALSRAMSDTTTSDAILAAGGSGKYSVARDTSTSGPIILITTDAASGAVALKTNQLLINRMGPAFQKLQADHNVPTGAYITVISLAQDEKATKQTKSELRSVIALAAVGLVLTVLLVAYAEKTLSRRAKAKAAPAAETAGAGPAGATAAVATPARSGNPDGRSEERRQRSRRDRETRPPQEQREPGQRRRPAPDEDRGLLDELTAASDDAARSRR